MVYLGWVISVILAVGGLFVYFRRQEKTEAAVAASEGHKARANQAEKKIFELEARIITLQDKVRVLNDQEAKKVTDVPSGIDWLLQSHGVHKNRAGAGALPFTSMPPASVADYSWAGGLFASGPSLLP